jgi:hypothetical protein
MTPQLITHTTIQDRVAALNRKLKRPATYFTPSNGSPEHAAPGHLFVTVTASGYQLIEIADEDGNTNQYIFGLSGERLDSRCFYTLLGVLLACL